MSAWKLSLADRIFGAAVLAGMAACVILGGGLLAIVFPPGLAAFTGFMALWLPAAAVAALCAREGCRALKGTQNAKPQHSEITGRLPPSRLHHR